MLKNASKYKKNSIFALLNLTIMENNVPQEWNKFYLKDVSFVNLMMRRIYNVLIVANPYDAFMLEDDGRIEEKIYNEYMELGYVIRQLLPKFLPQKRQLESCVQQLWIW